jgi:YbgC/YbaW family acyl-CoA thioester hydrolase
MARSTVESPCRLIAMLSEYRLRRRVNFYETDAAGLVHFSWFFRYMEEAEHALWRAAGLSIHARDGEFGFPRVSAAFEFHRALRFEQEFDVLLRVTGMSRRTIRYTCLLLDGEARIATGTLVVACVRRQSNEPMTAIEIPPAIVARLQVAPDPSDIRQSREAGSAGSPGTESNGGPEPELR